MQLPLPFMPEDERTSISTTLVRETFSHNGVCSDAERIALEKRYVYLLEETDEFDRQLVSYQGNKGQLVHGWIRYKEGFSAQLVQALLERFNIGSGHKILEPFSGSGTTLLVAKTLGIDAVGIEILPVCQLMWKAKSCVEDYDLDELQSLYELIYETTLLPVEQPFPHIKITEGAFSQAIEQSLMAYTEWFESLDISHQTKTLCKLVLTSILEEVSYTRKDGQYLRWDYRSSKVQTRNKVRIAQGKKPIKKLDKGYLPNVKDEILKALKIIIADIRELQRFPFRESDQRLLKGSALNLLPNLEADQFHAVITSPPYCNRYDYTRTYALELAYLNVGEEAIRELRQSQLSCTVENRSKVSDLERYYVSLNQETRYKEIMNIVESNSVLEEINHALQTRWDHGEINNRGILSMVNGYFTELTFVFAEIFRTCKEGAFVAFVNDNVRYGGEVIPIDLLTTQLAESIGFEPVQVYVLPQRKGNSSQQMSKFGREALRKSITVWKKPRL